MEQQRVVVLGGGRVGAAIARDLAGDAQFDVMVFDVDEQVCARLTEQYGVAAEAHDLLKADSLRTLLAPFDLVIGAVPGWMGYRTLEAVIKAGKNVVDISFFEEDPFSLDELARTHGVTAVVDCGVAPGLSNMVLGHLEERFDYIRSFRCLVGGLPQEPVAPWNYKAPYSPVDVIEMYTRPARFRRNGEEVVMPALTESEDIDFPFVGRLEAFNSDGLRTLLQTSSIPNLIEKTLRYPGHRAGIELLAASGLLDTEPRKLGSVVVRPVDMVSDILFEQWRQEETDYDLTAMRLVAEGELSGQQVRMVYDLVDKHDRDQGISSMARTTGYPCTAVARLVASGQYKRHGISPPEFVGRKDACYRAVLQDLDKRGVVFHINQTSVADALEPERTAAKDAMSVKDAV